MGDALVVDPDVVELNGFLTNGIPDSDTHSCPVIGCTKLPNERGWICPPPDSKKCITGKDKLIKASTAIAVINEKVADLRARLEAAVAGQSAAATASSAKIAELEENVRAISAREVESNRAKEAAEQAVREALAREKSIKEERQRLDAEREAALAAQKRAKNNNNASKLAAAASAVAAARDALAAKDAELKAAQAGTVDARRDLAVATQRASDLDRELADAKGEIETKEAFLSSTEGVFGRKVTQLTAAYNKLKDAHIAHLDRKISQIENYKTKKVLIRTDADIPILDEQKRIIEAQKVEINKLIVDPETGINAPIVLEKINALEAQLKAIQNDENRDYGRPEMAGGKRKTHRRKVSKRKHTKKRNIRNHK